MRSEDVAALYLNFGVRRRCVVIFTIWPLFSRGKSSQYLPYRRCVGPSAGLDIWKKYKS
jgi:hypothetical protein